MKALGLTALLLLAACGDAPALLPHGAVAAMPDRSNPRCLITRVVDGDTVRIRCSGSENAARLTSFDTPETHRPGCPAEDALGHRATAYLENRLRTAETIIPKTHGTDRYNRMLVSLTVDGQPLEDIMVSAGLAVPYRGGRRINWCQRLEA